MMFSRVDKLVTSTEQSSNPYPKNCAEVEPLRLRLKDPAEIAEEEAVEKNPDKLRMRKVIAHKKEELRKSMIDASTNEGMNYFGNSKRNGHWTY